MTWTSLGYLFLGAVACWLLVKLLGAPLFEIVYRPEDDPPIHIDEELAREVREARQFEHMQRIRRRMSPSDSSVVKFTDARRARRS